MEMHLVEAKFPITLELLERLNKGGPHDFMIHEYLGERLILRGGHDTSKWSDMEIVFGGVVYMAIPAYLDCVTFAIASDELLGRIATNVDHKDRGLISLAIIEDNDWAEGKKTHLVIAESLSVSAVE